MSFDLKFGCECDCDCEDYEDVPSAGYGSGALRESKRGSTDCAREWSFGSKCL